MSTDFRAELTEFYQFLGEQLANGDVAISPEEVLDQWRAFHPPEGALAEDVAAVQEALDDWQPATQA